MQASLRALAAGRERPASHLERRGATPARRDDRAYREDSGGERRGRRAGVRNDGAASGWRRFLARPTLPDVCRGTLVALAVVAGVGAADPPVRISNIVSGPKGHVTLTSTAPQPVTAWSLATITRTANGTHREVETVDGYLSEVTQGLPGSNPRLERLMPGQARDIAMDQLPPDATLEIVAAVLEDGTAVGDPRVIEAIFARRVKERDALRSIVEAFQYALRAAQGEAALDLLHDRLLTIAPGESLLPCRAAIDAVDAYRQRGGDEEAIAESLRRYAGFVAREYELAKRASSPKAP